MYGRLRRGSENQMKKYVDNNRTIWLDISPRVFRQNGFEKIRHGDRILDPDGYESIALGFARYNYIFQYEKFSVLWYRKLNNRSLCCFCFSKPDDYQKLE